MFVNKRLLSFGTQTFSVLPLSQHNSFSLYFFRMRTLLNTARVYRNNSTGRRNAGDGTQSIRAALRGRAAAQRRLHVGSPESHRRHVPCHESGSVTVQDGVTASTTTTTTTTSGRPETRGSRGYSESNARWRKGWRCRC